MLLEETPFSALTDSRLPTGLGGKWYGVYPALVTDIKDPDGQGRVLVTLPWAPDTEGETYEAWARLATMMAGRNRGSWYIPDPDDEVLVAFEGGDPRRPYVVGMLWNGRDSPPERMDGAGRNYLKVIRSRNGVKMTMDDMDGQEKFIVETPGGQKMTMRDGPGFIEIVDSNGNFIRMEPAGITVNTPMKLVITANLIEATASMVTVDAGITKFSGMVECATLKTNSVISPQYTNGSGNKK